MHLNDEQIQRLLHGELDERGKEAVALHVAGCDACARQVADAEREEAEIFGLLARLDHPAPRVDARSLATARAGIAVWGRRAAGVAVVAALAGAAYAIPGSPLPAWVEQVTAWVTGQDAASPTTDEAPAPSTPVTSGIAVPAGPQFAIVFSAEQSAGVAAISTTEGPNVVVRVLGGTTTFTTDADRLTIDNRASNADYEIELPRHTKLVGVTVGARRLVVKDGDELATGLPLDARGRRLVALTPTER